MEIHFITSNTKKFDEARAVLPDLRQLAIDLPEIQEVDARAIIEAKLDEALKHRSGGFVVEDTSLYLDCLNGLPGPLIKWFLRTVGNDGLARIAERLGNPRAEVRTIVGYATAPDDIRYFEGAIAGTVSSPAGAGAGIDPIFRPEGSVKSFAEMGPEEKNKISMRRIAFEKLKRHLEENGR